MVSVFPSRFTFTICVFSAQRLHVVNKMKNTLHMRCIACYALTRPFIYIMCFFSGITWPWVQQKDFSLHRIPLLTQAGANLKFKAHSGWWTLARVKATEVSKCPSWLHTSHLITGHFNHSCPITVHLVWLRNGAQVTTCPTMLKQSEGSVLYSIHNESLTVLCIVIIYFSPILRGNWNILCIVKKVSSL